MVHMSLPFVDDMVASSWLNHLGVGLYEADSALYHPELQSVPPLGRLPAAVNLRFFEPTRVNGSSISDGLSRGAVS